MNRTLPLVLAAMLPLAACNQGTTPTMATAPRAAGMPGPSVQDQDFANKMATSSEFAVAISQVAVQRPDTPATGAFAQRVMTDQQGLHHQVLALVAQEGMAVPVGMDPTGNARVRAMQARGGAIQSTYTGYIADVLQTQTVAARSEASTGTDPALRDFATRILPTLEQQYTSLKANTGQ